MYFLWYLLIGLAAGWIANLIVKGGGSGLFVNLIVGLIGGVLGGWSTKERLWKESSSDWRHQKYIYLVPAWIAAHVRRKS